MLEAGHVRHLVVSAFLLVHCNYNIVTVIGVKNKTHMFQLIT